MKKYSVVRVLLYGSDFSIKFQSDNLTLATSVLEAYRKENPETEYLILEAKSV